MDHADCWQHIHGSAADWPRSGLLELSCAVRLVSGSDVCWCVLIIIQIWVIRVILTLSYQHPATQARCLHTKLSWDHFWVLSHTVQAFQWPASLRPDTHLCDGSPGLFSHFQFYFENPALALKYVCYFCSQTPAHVVPRLSNSFQAPLLVWVQTPSLPLRLGSKLSFLTKPGVRVGLGHHEPSPQWCCRCPMMHCALSSPYSLYSSVSQLCVSLFFVSPNHSAG